MRSSGFENALSERTVLQVKQLHFPLHCTHAQTFIDGIIREVCSLETKWGFFRRMSNMAGGRKVLLPQLSSVPGTFIFLLSVFDALLSIEFWPRFLGFVAFKKIKIKIKKSENE